MADPPNRFPVIFRDPDTGERTPIGTAVIDVETGDVKVHVTDPGVARLVGDKMWFSIKDDDDGK